jgi:hypothetical protein
MVGNQGFFGDQNEETELLEDSDLSDTLDLYGLERVSMSPV